jgi:hypothetical protein
MNQGYFGACKGLCVNPSIKNFGATDKAPIVRASNWITQSSNNPDRGKKVF